jgi:WD40 repeat protein
MIKSNIPSNFQIFNDKMILSTSKEDKKIFLWDENTMTILYTYEDSNMKSFISKNKLNVIGKDLYSEYILTLQENKSLISIWKTNSSECAIKCSPIDERITSIDTSLNNKIFAIATETGNLYLYELFSGNLLTTVQISGSVIYDLKFCLRDGGLIIFLCEDYIKLFKLENLQNNNSNNNSPVIEIPNYDNFTKILHLQELNFFIFYNNKNNKIGIYSSITLQNIKNVLIENDDYSSSGEIVEIVPNINNLIVAFESGKIFLINLEEILKSDLNLVSLKSGVNIFPIIHTENKITTITDTKKYILTGHEDGKITLFNKNNFKQENIFSQHKGGITNIVYINRPISQYGLNFNNTIEETVVKSLKKSSTGYNNSIFVKNSIKNEDFVENFLEKCLSDYYLKCDIGINTNVSITNTTNTSTKTVSKINDIKSNINNLDDNNFLRKKIKELYSIMNNQ